jgi:hypothetical protein
MQKTQGGLPFRDLSVADCRSLQSSPPKLHLPFWAFDERRDTSGGPHRLQIDVTGAQRETLKFRATRPPDCICRPAGRGFRKAVNASRTQCTVRFATFANRQTETHFAVTAKNVKQHFNAFFFTRDFHLKLRSACELRTASMGQLRPGQTLLSAPIGVTPRTRHTDHTRRRRRSLEDFATPGRFDHANRKPGLESLAKRNLGLAVEPSSLQDRRTPWKNSLVKSAHNSTNG